MTLTTAQQQALNRQLFKTLLTERLDKMRDVKVLQSTFLIVEHLHPDKIQDEIVLGQLYCTSIASLEKRVLERMRLKF